MKKIQIKGNYQLKITNNKNIWIISKYLAASVSNVENLVDRIFLRFKNS